MLLTPRIKLILNEQAAMLKEGIDPWHHDFLVKHEITADEHMQLSVHHSSAIKAFANTSETMQNVLWVLGESENGIPLNADNIDLVFLSLFRDKMMARIPTVLDNLAKTEDKPGDSKT